MAVLEAYTEYDPIAVKRAAALLYGDQNLNRAQKKPTEQEVKNFPKLKDQAAIIDYIMKGAD